MESVRRARREAGLTQAELASRAGIERSHLVRIEAGTVDLKLSTLRSIARALGVTMNTILEDRDGEER